MPKKNRLIPPSVPARAIADEESMWDLSDSIDWANLDLELSESDLAVIAEIEDSERDLFWLKDAEAALTRLTGIEAKDINSDLLLNPYTLHPLCLADSSGVDAARLSPHGGIKLSELGELAVSVRSGEPIKSDTGAFIFGKEEKNIFLATHTGWREPVVLQRYRHHYRVMDKRTGKAFAAPDGGIYYSVPAAKALFPKDAPHLITAAGLTQSRVLDKRTGKVFAAPDGRIYYSVPDAKATFPADSSHLVTAAALSRSRVMDKRTGKPFAAPDGRIYDSVPGAKAAFPADALHLITAVALSQSRVIDKRTGKPFAAPDGMIYYSVLDAKTACPDDAPHLVTANALSYGRVMDKRTGNSYVAPDGRIYDSVHAAKALFPDDAPYLVTAAALSQSRVIDKRTGKLFMALDGKIYYSVADAQAAFPDDAPFLITANAFSTSKSRAKKCQPADPSGSFSLTEEATHTDDAPCPLVPAALPSSRSKKRPPPIKNSLSVSKDAFFASSREDLASSTIISATDASKRVKPNSTGV